MTNKPKKNSGTVGQNFMCTAYFFRFRFWRHWFQPWKFHNGFFWVTSQKGSRRFFFYVSNLSDFFLLLATYLNERVEVAWISKFSENVYVQVAKLWTICYLFSKVFSFNLPFSFKIKFCLGNGAIQSKKVEKIMKSVDRLDFCKNYEDSPQYIGYGATISAPHMVKK